jgi:hypothetical protein
LFCEEFLISSGKLGATVAGTDPSSTGGHPQTSTEKRRLQMNKFRFTINVLAIAIFTFAFASMAQAQATRTWVSGVGDDANPCSRTAPCKTFAGAISKTAVDGEIDALDPGGFGTVTITKAITIDGNGWGSILAAGTNGINVNLTANSGSNTVEIRNLSINGAFTGLTGIKIFNTNVAGVSVFIENCVIFNFRTSPGRGIDDQANNGGKLHVSNTLVKNNLNQGIIVQSVGPGDVKATLDGVTSEANGVGVLSSHSSNIVTCRNCVANSNVTIGFGAETSGQMDIINSQASHNATGVDSNGAGTNVRCSRTTVSRNSVDGLGFHGGTIMSYGNCEVSANNGNNGPFTVGGPVLQ